MVSHTPSSSAEEREKTEGWVEGSRPMTGETECPISRVLCEAVGEVNTDVSGAGG